MKHKILIMLAISLVLIVAVGISLACEDNDDAENPAPTTTGTPTPAPETASVTITSPNGTDGITAGAVNVSVNISNFELVDKLGQAPASGEGHAHYYLDVEPPTAPDEPEVTQEGTYKVSTNTSVTWQNISPGQHTFAVQLVNNDHTPLQPAVVDKVTVAVEAEPSPTLSPSPSPTYTPSPDVSITSPNEGGDIKAGDVMVSVNVIDFALVDKFGEGPLWGEGHIHYYLDVEPPITPGEPAVTEEGTYKVSTETSITWEDVDPGEHTFAVQLVNNDHTPLETPVTDRVTVTVEGKASPTPASTPSKVSLDLTAENIAFNKDILTVPAGAEVTLTFENKEIIAHNFALYESSAATSALFVGEIITGPTTIEYEFTAPDTPGDYFFRCDVHPITMTGTFVVTE